MTAETHDQATAEARLWREIEDKRTGMLGLMGLDQHFQPMTAFVERDVGRVWFFTYKDTDLAEAVAGGAGRAMFVFQQRDLQACIGGRLALDPDRTRMDRYWNAPVAAWYPQGKDDPRLTLLRLDCEDAQVWLSEAGPTRFIWEIAKANLTHKQPDLGRREDLNFH